MWGGDPFNSRGPFLVDLLMLYCSEAYFAKSFTSIS